MKIKNVDQFIKYLSLFVLLAGTVFLFASPAGAQTKRVKKLPARPRDTEFSVPCPRAINIGLEGVIKLQDKDIMRRLRGREGDSDTELLIEKNAFENYLRCRRAETEKNLQMMPSDERAAVNNYAIRARQLAQMRVNLLYGVQFDERYDDPVNYAVSLNAVALVEDYKGEMAWVYLQTRDSNALGNAEEAARDEQQIGKLLTRIEKIAIETDKADKFAEFNKTIEKTLAEIADNVGTEKRVTTAFLIRLLRMNLPDEN